MTASICFVGLDNYPVLNPRRGHDYFGGESVQQTLLAKSFAAMGYQTSMIVKDHGQPQGEQLHGIKIWKTYAESSGIPVVRFVHPRLTSILTALEHADADVYYQSCAGMLTGVVAYFCRKNGRRFIFRVAHDTDCIPGQQIIRFWRDRKLYEYGLRRADCIAAQSRQQMRLLDSNYGLPSVMVDMVVETPTVAPDRRKDIDILWVNNLRPFKQPHLAIDLAARLTHREVTMIGGAVPGHEALYAEMEQRARALPNVRFLGHVPYSEVNDFFSRARVFVNTSEHEGFPNSFLQAWIRGVPVISFFDPDGLIQNRGLGRAPETLDEMVRSTDELLADENEWCAVSDRCARYARETHSADAVMRRYVELGNLPRQPLP